MDVANSSSSSSIDTISILVVDDDNTCLSIIAAILKKFNYQVVAVKHAKDALYTLRITGGAFDLVVSDVHMPDMNGFELQQVITEEFDLPVVLMSADDKEGIALKGLEGGAAFFIMKPISPDDVRDLWQFAAMKKRSNQNVVIEETPQENTLKGKKVVEEEIAPNSAASANEGATTNKKESKKKNPRREGSEEKNGGKSPSSSKKKPKIVWTNSLHNRFLEAIRSIGLDKAVPKKILEVMSIPGLTRENVASHLQKYRIFLRRVSEASYKIQYSPRKGLSMSFNSSGESPRISPHSRLGKLNYNPQNRGHFNVAAPLPSIGASSSTQFGQSRLFSNNGTWYKPPVGTSTLTPRNPCVRVAPNSFEARALIPGHMANVGQDHSGIAMSSSFGAFPNTSTYGVPAQNTFGSLDVISPSLKSTYPTNYVGYSLSNILSLAESSKNNDRCGGSSSTWGITSFPREEPQVAMVPNVSLVENFEANNNGQELLSHGVADNRSMHSGFQNVEGIQESALSPIYDLADFDMASAQQAFDKGCFETTWSNQLTNVLDRPLQQDFGGETNISSNLYDDVVQWDNFVNASYSFDQAFNQSESSQINSQGFAASSQINEIVMEPNNEFSFENFVNSFEFGTFAQLNNDVLSPTLEERNDDDFLESLLAPFGEDHCFHGSNNM